MKLSKRTTKILFILMASLLAGIFFVTPAHATGQLASGVYTVDRVNGLLTGIKAGTPTSELISNMEGSASGLSVYSRDGSVCTGGSVATGMSVRLIEGGIAVDTLTLVVNGDANGDGAVSVADYTLVRLHLLGKKTLSGAYLKAGDVSGNGNLGIGDYMLIRLCILGLCELEDGALPLAGYVIGIDPGHQRKANNELEPMAPAAV